MTLICFLMADNWWLLRQAKKEKCECQISFGSIFDHCDSRRYIQKRHGIYQEVTKKYLAVEHGTHNVLAMGRILFFFLFFLFKAPPQYNEYCSWWSFSSSDASYYRWTYSMRWFAENNFIFTIVVRTDDATEAASKKMRKKDKIESIWNRNSMQRPNVGSTHIFSVFFFYFTLWIGNMMKMTAKPIKWIHSLFIWYRLE